MRQRPDARTDPLAPYDAVVTFLSAIVAVLLLLVALATIFGSGSFLGIGDSEACAVVAPGVVPYGEHDVAGQEETAFIPGLRPDSRFAVRQLEVCDKDPAALTKAVSTADPAAHLLLLVGFLVLSRRLIRRARTSGMFTISVAHGTRQLGWFLLAGALVAELVAATSKGVVVNSAVRGTSWADGYRHFDVPWTLVVVALGIITIGRVLRQAVMLQDDADATI